MAALLTCAKIGRATALGNKYAKRAKRTAYLARKIKLRDQAALACLYDKTVGRVFGLSMRITTNKVLSEEVISDVFMYAWRNIEDYDAHRASPLGTVKTTLRTAQRVLREYIHENQSSEGESYGKV